MPQMIRFALSTGLIVPLVLASVGVQAEDWSRWRGPTGTGHTKDTNLPVTWSDDSIAWKVDLDGSGQSSPVVWENRIFLTSAVKNGQQVDRLVMCFDKSDGKMLWKHTAVSGAAEQVHKMNSFATASCATDGQYVVTFFGDGGIQCFTVDGKKLWSHDLGTFPNVWGTAASPIIFGDVAIQNCDASGESYLIGFDTKTGKTAWKTKRRNTPRGGWSTPIIAKTNTRLELVLNGELGVQAYNPENGEDYWYCKSFNGRGTPTAVFAHNLVYVVNGKAGDVYSVKPGGAGDVTSSQMAWHTPRRGGRDLPSPIVVGRSLFVVNTSGVATIYDALSGAETRKERLAGQFSASPIAAGELIYVQNEAGQTYVLKVEPEIELIATNTIAVKDDEVFRASLAPSDGKLLMRSNKVLYCIRAAN
ncbi:MAG: PQQ-binding-like beta-propeller repeat protein [Planctomycetota bacterium]|nr:PQQ-binding-like beta-propeller repeat protein [Planctomycetota bacterium]